MLPYTPYILRKWNLGTAAPDGRTYTDASGANISPHFFSQIYQEFPVTLNKSATHYYQLSSPQNNFSLGRRGIVGPLISGKCFEVQTAIVVLTITGYSFPATNALSSKQEWQCLLGRLHNSLYCKTIFSIILCFHNLAIQIIES